ncbi:hypothetical protein [Pseudonocardia sp. 73-21]|mgnify:CR=1 FL=1|nr:hypothetical protein [Pseudonocardia sp. 73-21]
MGPEKLMAAIVAGLNGDDVVAILDEVDEYELSVEMADGTPFVVRIEGT